MTKAKEEAEQRIRESQEQEPVACVSKLDRIYLNPKLIPADYYLRNPELFRPLFAQPIIPPSLEELQRELAESNASNKAVELALADVPYKGSYADGVEYLKRENADLTRKLAEQQAVIKPINIFYMIEVERAGWFVGRKSGELVFTQHAEEALTFYDKHSAEIIMADYFSSTYMHPTTYGGVSVTEHAWCNGPDGKEELNKLLSEARSQAVPEDSARLDFVIKNGAFITQGFADADGKDLQLLTQNVDEEYVILHNADSFFKTVREAIDAAMLAAAPKVMEVDLWK